MFLIDAVEYMKPLDVVTVLVLLNSPTMSPAVDDRSSQDTRFTFS
jgi:hypothetical protein